MGFRAGHVGIHGIPELNSFSPKLYLLKECMSEPNRNKKPFGVWGL